MEAKTHPDQKASQCPAVILPLRHKSPLNPQWDICGHHTPLSPSVLKLQTLNCRLETLNRATGLGIRQSYFLSVTVGTWATLQSIQQGASLMSWQETGSLQTSCFWVYFLYIVGAQQLCVWNEQINLIEMVSFLKLIGRLLLHWGSECCMCAGGWVCAFQS